MCESAMGNCLPFDPCTVLSSKCCRPCNPCEIPLPECKKPAFGKRLCVRLSANKVIPSITGKGWGYGTFVLDNCQTKVNWSVVVHAIENTGERCIVAGLHCASPKEDNTVDNLVKEITLVRYSFLKYDECTGVCTEAFIYAAEGCWSMCDAEDPLNEMTAEQLACGMLNLQVSDDMPEVRGQLCCYEDVEIVV